MNRYLIAISLACITVAGCDDDSGVPSNIPLNNCPEGKVFDSTLGCIDKTPQPHDSTKCKDDDDCPGTDVCRNEVCKPEDKQECNSSDDCPETRICDGGSCKENTSDKPCQSEEDCPDYYTCTEKTCVETPKGKECTFDYDCLGDKVCKHGYCVDDAPSVECQGDEDCLGDLVCKSGKCTEPQNNGCDGDEDCTDGKVCQSNTCVEPVVPQPCEGDEDCSDNLICIAKVCSKDPLRCEGDFDCDTAAGFFCSKHRCVDGSIECNEDNECTTPKVCRSHACVYECQDSSECPADKTCKGYRCQYECSKDSECDAFSHCKNHYCVNSCSEDTDCPNSTVCRSKKCQYACETATQANDCKNNPNGNVCVNHQCRECGKDSDCNNNLSCISNQCVESGNIVFPCILNNNNGSNYTKFISQETYQYPRNADGSVDLCKIGYRPKQSDIDSGVAEDKCIPLFVARDLDFYGDNIDSNCDGYDYDLYSAVFVTAHGQGVSEGSDSHDGKYSEEHLFILPKATINSALQFDPSALTVNYMSYFYYPDVIVAKNARVDLFEPIQVPGLNVDALQVYADHFKKLNDGTPFASAYEHHLALIDKYLSAPSDIQNYIYYNENSYPKSAVRIFGGFTRNDTDLNLLVRSEGDRTTQTYHIDSATLPFYALMEAGVGSTGNYPLSLTLYHFNMNINADATTLDAGTTLAGLNCGQVGCRALDFSDVTIDVKAPNGVNHNTESLQAGSKGNDGVKGFIEETTSTRSPVCGQPQSCGSVSAGVGGCGGYAYSNVGAKYTDYNGEPSGLNGNNGGTISHDGKTVAGGQGGAGLGISISNSECSNSNIDPSKGSGENGKDGSNGINGSNDFISYSFVRQGNDLYIQSNYDTATGIHGSDGAPGGGGGGAAAYQMYSKSVFGKSTWMSASSGGNGGCGGKGGIAGGSGGSAIGIILRSAASGINEFAFDNLIVNVTGGNGGFGQSGSAGGEGGAAGESLARQSSNQCQKATPAGAGGKGGGGGAGAGGKAGPAYAYLLSCGRSVTALCDHATLSTPCFNDFELSTLINCGFSFSHDFLSYVGSSYGTATPGLDAANATTSAQTGNVAPAELAGPGDAAVLKAYIE